TRFSRDWSSDVCSSDLKLEALAQNDARSIFNQKQNYAAPSSRAAAGFDDKAQAANAEFYFRATGYNSSLKKRLVFEGNYITSSRSEERRVGKEYSRRPL